MANPKPTFWLIAGPNGVGKTTYAFRQLEKVTGSYEFINMDEIARGIAPLRPSAAQREAGRIALARAGNMINDQRTFTMETTMSGNVHAELMATAISKGMAVNLLYFSVNDPAICITRVARRVAEGGHDVEETVIRRRYHRSHNNLQRYTALANRWRTKTLSSA